MRAHVKRSLRRAEKRAATAAGGSLRVPTSLSGMPGWLVSTLPLGKKAIESLKLGTRGEGAADGVNGATRRVVGLVARLSDSPGRLCGAVASRCQGRSRQDALALAAAGEGDRVMILEVGPARGYDGVVRGHLLDAAK